MSETNETAPDMNKALFANLIMMFTSSAMQQLGKLVDPSTNKAEVNLQGAQVWIDMLSMLREKTQGNLDADEKQMLDESLASLQMNYVATAKEHPAQAAAKAKAEAEAEGAAREPAAAREEESAPPPPAAEPETEAKKESGHAPKYHKSYGS